MTALADAGLREVAVAPGSRSTPLVMALADEERITCRVHLDERSCAFFALGVGKASGVPAAVLTTSGTAVANLCPAVVEASQGEVGLIVLTADRPHHLRDSDANQAIDQIRPFGVYPLASREVAPPSAKPAALRHLRNLAFRAVSEAGGVPAGVVHLNFPFDKPLEPEAAEAGPGRDEAGPGLEPDGSGHDGSPLGRVDRGRLAVDGRVMDDLRREIRASRRGVIVSGPSAEPERLGAAVAAFAEASGFPLLADPLSGCRWMEEAAGGVSIASYPLILRDPRVAAALAPDLVLRVGAAPTSEALLGWLELHRAATQIVIDDGRRWKDHTSTASWYVRADAAGTLRELAGRAPRLRSGGRSAVAPESPTSGDTRSAGPPVNAVRPESRASGEPPEPPVAEPSEPSADRREWRSLWQRAELAVRSVVQTPRTQPPNDRGPRTGTARPDDPASSAFLHEGRVAFELMRCLPEGAQLFVSSSMPIRDLDAFGGARSRSLAVHGNRGASGIDGIVSTAFGVAAVRGPVACLIGDVAFFHDQNGLLWSREVEAPVVFVLADNDGGGIFHELPVAAHEPHFTRFFATPHGSDLSRAASVHGLNAATVGILEVGEAVAQALEAGETAVIRVALDRVRDHRGRRATAEAAAKAARGALGLDR